MKLIIGMKIIKMKLNISYIIILLNLLNFNCMNKKIYPHDSDFKEVESNFKISQGEADDIYDREFVSNFKVALDSNFLKLNKKIIFIQDKAYYIGYYTVLDKRGYQNPNLKYLAKINPNNGKILVIE